MRVSIIIPTLNEAERICETLQMLQSARAGQHEVVLADGGSTDDTITIARPLVDIIVESGPGRAAQLNAGAEAASGDVFWFLHADTLCETNSVRDLLAAANGSGSQLFWGRFDVRLDAASWPYRMIEHMMNLRSRVTSVSTGDQGIFVSRALYVQTGGFSLLPLMEDIEYSKRLRRVCKPLNLSARITTSARRWRQAGVSRTILLMWCIRLGYVCGVSPATLANWYRKKSV